MVKVGDVAPDFVLKDQNGEEFRLSDFRGRKVLLSFHPLAWTSICERQMKALEEHYDKLEELNVVPVGISVDSVPTKRHGQSTWALKSSESLRTSGPWGSCRKYGLFREKDGISERANVIIDENGRIAFVKVYPLGELPDLNEVLAVLKG